MEIILYICTNGNAVGSIRGGMASKRQTNELFHSGFYQPARLGVPLSLRHESDERGASESCGRPPAQHFGSHDQKPVHGSAHRYRDNSPYPEFERLHRDGGELRECRPDEPPAIHGRDFRRQCRHDGHHLDHFRLLVRGQHLRLQHSAARNRRSDAFHEEEYLQEFRRVSDRFLLPLHGPRPHQQICAQSPGESGDVAVPHLIHVARRMVGADILHDRHHCHDGGAEFGSHVRHNPYHVLAGLDLIHPRLRHYPRRKYRNHHHPGARLLER